MRRIGSRARRGKFARIWFEREAQQCRVHVAGGARREVRLRTPAVGVQVVRLNDRSGVVGQNIGQPAPLEEPVSPRGIQCLVRVDLSLSEKAGGTTEQARQIVTK
jgi:hypothetical protein